MCITVIWIYNIIYLYDSVWMLYFSDEINACFEKTSDDYRIDNVRMDVSWW